ncbi:MULTISPECIES: response regulator [unclassified Mesorhizobium]|uniref:response regulator n=1 Tax=unclassified Mesorhizobium TaxID=325217 RepID=UPI0013EC3FD2|nr:MULTISPECIES: response regulator [unclassified Mesorhizobium]
MTGEQNLSGRTILVVEDEYYLATDTARALQGAGAEIIGPCPTEDDAQAELRERRPDAAIIDINLGQGASFNLPETLSEQGIPFVFITGYDQDVIPQAFSHIERLEKPVQPRQVVGAVERLLERIE